MPSNTTQAQPANTTAEANKTVKKTTADLFKDAKQVPSKFIGFVDLKTTKDLKATVVEKAQFETVLSGHSLFLDAARD
jgi:hypothetical protein